MDQPTATVPEAVVTTIASEYAKMSADRTSYLDRGRLCASLTIPFLLPPSEFSANQSLPTPNQAIGAQGVNNLANQLLSSLFPPNSPFFRFMVDDATVTELAADPKARAAIEEKLNELERIISLRVGSRLPRASLLFLLKLLIVSGNAVLVLRKDGVRVHRLDSFVVSRDGSGNVMKVIIREEVSLEALPEATRDAIKSMPPGSGDTAAREGDVPIYTVYRRDGNLIRTSQYARNIEIKESAGSWPAEKAPVLPLRWSWQDGEDYGRAYVEEFLGDLQAAEGLSKAIREASAAAAKVVILVNPNGQTEEDDLSEAENLDVISGRIEDVNMLQLNKSADLQIAKSTLDELLKRLSQAFLMHLGVRRDAERVTAEETRMVVAALENSLGGTYALFAQELQLPLIKMVMGELEREGRIPKLSGAGGKASLVEPVITTGVEALGRGEDFSRYSTFVSTILNVLGPEIALQYLNVPDFIRRAGTALNLDMDGLVKTQDDIENERQQAEAQRQQQLAEQTMAKGAEKAAGPVVQAMIEQQGTPQQ